MTPHPFNGPGTHLGNLARLSAAETCSCSPENPTFSLYRLHPHLHPTRNQP